ncbi:MULTISPECIES: hypothetical protein [Clostridium]|jgi:hypothetical protein|uniref:Uncharacterized protein n=2 Tax=Clostridium TaxID=1485 RepID=A0A2T0BNT3_9CLOT|nr:hypothetical protein [Clostridium luticellarii]PRR85523.1 hypothetical protein CLLU_14440 [Clostridium luticellarii]
MSVEPIEVTDALYNTSKRLDKGADIITSKAKDFAQSEKIYRIALAKEITKLRTEGVPTTLINNLARGNENVADLKFNRDLSQEVLKASHSMLRALETEVSALQSILRVQERIEK